MTKIKICGLRTQADVDVVNEVQPEMIGFIFDPTRRRFVHPLAAENLRQQLDESIESVGVFVNASIDEVLEVLRQCHVNWVQLHGEESNSYIEELRRRIGEDSGIRRLHRGCEVPRHADAETGLEALDDTGGNAGDSKGDPEKAPKVKILKAFRIDRAEDLQAAENSAADLVLLDHGIGGTGESFDWSLIRDFSKVRNFLLAGGLSSENVKKALKKAKPYGVDASSSLETCGHKDLTKAEAFVSAVRG